MISLGDNQMVMQTDYRRYSVLICPVLKPKKYFSMVASLIKGSISDVMQSDTHHILFNVLHYISPLLL